MIGIVGQIVLWCKLGDSPASALNGIDPMQRSLDFPPQTLRANDMIAPQDGKLAANSLAVLAGEAVHLNANDCISII